MHKIYGEHSSWLRVPFNIDNEFKGPIVRIRPDVLHVNDPDFLDQLFAGASKRRDKYKIACNGFATPGAGLGTIEHDLHRTRRAALNPFFSKQSIRRLEPIIQEALGKVLDRLSQHAKTGSPVQMNLLYSALTSDVINNYAFGPSESSLERPDLEAGEGYHVACYFPFLPVMYAKLPLPIVKVMFPKVTVFVSLVQVSQIIQ
jgi:cytochrome P450